MADERSPPPGEPADATRAWFAAVVRTRVLAGAAAGIFALHRRWIYTHFSSDGYLYDSGWLAYLFGAADPLLRNPSSINGLSFYAHHLSPHIFLFGAPLALGLGWSGIEIFAYHQGLFYALFFVGACLLAAAAPVGYPTRAVLLLSGAAIGGLSNALLQSAGYPHFEIAMIAGTAIASAAGVHRRWSVFAACMAWLPCIREDGGFYGAFVCAICLALEERADGEWPTRARRLATVMVLEILVGLCAVAVKATVFPGFDAFSVNFSGDGWSHVTRALLVERLQSVAANPTVIAVLVGSAFLATRDKRYGAGLVLLSPLYMLHLLSVRAEHGHFTLYYILPWLLPPLTWLAVASVRARAAHAIGPEAAVIAIASLGLAAPTHAALGLNGQFWYVARWSYSRPVANLRAMTSFVPWVLARYPDSTATAGGPPSRACASMGIAALAPNRFKPQQIVDGSTDLTMCRALLLLRADMDYGVLATRAEQLGFARAGARQSAEIWLRMNR
jgi:hypothetical protein